MLQIVFLCALTSILMHASEKTGFQGICALKGTEQRYAIFQLQLSSQDSEEQKNNETYREKLTTFYAALQVIQNAYSVPVSDESKRLKKAFFEKNNAWKIFYARHKGKVIGSAVGSLGCDGCYLRLCAVDKKHQRCGVGTALVVSLYNMLPAGVPLTTQVESTESNTLAFLKSLAFSVPSIPPLTSRYFLCKKQGKQNESVASGSCDSNTNPLFIKNARRGGVLLDPETTVQHSMLMDWRPGDYGVDPYDLWALEETAIKKRSWADVCKKSDEHLPIDLYDEKLWEVE